MAKDRTPDNARPSGGAPGPAPAAAGRAAAGRRQGRAHPPADQRRRRPQRPWGLIAAAVAVVVFAAAVITYAVVQVNEANANKVESLDEIEGLADLRATRPARTT